MVSLLRVAMVMLVRNPNEDTRVRYFFFRNEAKLGTGAFKGRSFRLLSMAAGTTQCLAGITGSNRGTERSKRRGRAGTDKDTPSTLGRHY